jgi:hypothetical protein
MRQVRIAGMTRARWISWLWIREALQIVAGVGIPALKNTR